MLTEMPGNLVQLQNRLARSRAPLSVTLCGRPVKLTFDCSPEPVEGQLAVPVTFGGLDGCLWLPLPFVEWSIMPLETGVPAIDDPESLPLLSLLLELAALDILAQIEGGGHGPIRLGAVQGAGDGKTMILGVRVILPDAEMNLRLDLPIPLVRAFEAYLDRNAPAQPSDPVALPLHLVVEAGRQQLTLSEISSLRMGDVVVVDRPAAVLRIDAGPVAPIRWVKSQIMMDGSFAMDSDCGPIERMVMTDTLPDVPWDEVPLTMVFEHGRIAMPLGEVRTLGSGSMISLSSATPARVDLVVNGARIGTGEIIRLGDECGVRILQLSGMAGGRPLEAMPLP